MDFQKLEQARKAELRSRQSEAVKRWGPMLKLVEARYKAEGKKLPSYMTSNIAQCCDNLFDHTILRGSGLNEETQSSAMSYVRQMLPVIPAILPSLVSDQISMVQAIDLPQANVYFMNVKTDVAKGSVAAGTSLNAATTGHASSSALRKYASDWVTAEVVAAPSQARTATFAAVGQIPLIAGTITLTLTTTISAAQAVETFTDNSDGTLTGSGGSTATYTASTGVIVVDAGSGNTVDAVAGAVNYRTDIEQNTDGIGGLRFEVTAEAVNAQVFPLRVDYTAFAEVLMQRAHGLVLSTEAMKFATQEIRFAIDQLVLDQAYTAASGTGGAGSVGTFDTSVGTGQEWIFRIQEFKKYISKGSAAIFAKTLRARGNVLVCGTSVCALIENLNGFKPAASVGTTPPAGPYVAGTLNGYTVICNPFYSANLFVEGFRSNNWLHAGLAFCPYLLMYSTNPVQLATMDTQRGFMSMAGIKTINAGMFAHGLISNF